MLNESVDFSIYRMFTVAEELCFQQTMRLCTWIRVRRLHVRFVGRHDEGRTGESARFVQVPPHCWSRVGGSCTTLCRSRHRCRARTQPPDQDYVVRDLETYAHQFCTSALAGAWALALFFQDFVSPRTRAPRRRRTVRHRIKMRPDRQTSASERCPDN